MIILAPHNWNEPAYVNWPAHCTVMKTAVWGGRAGTMQAPSSLRTVRPPRAATCPRAQVATATVRGWWRPITSTQIVPTVATAAIGIRASGKLPVSA
jgi:hypothetical protein